MVVSVAEVPKEHFPESNDVVDINETRSFFGSVGQLVASSPFPRFVRTDLRKKFLENELEKREWYFEVVLNCISFLLAVHLCVTEYKINLIKVY